MRVIYCILLVCLLVLTQSEDLNETQQEVVRLFTEASNLFNEGKYWRAISIWKQLVKDFPVLKEPWENLGVSYERLGKTDKAISTYIRAVEHPHLAVHDKPYANLCTLLKNMGLGNRKNTLEAKQDAQAICEAGLEVHPKHLKMLQVLGILHVEVLEFEQGVVLLERALEVNPLDRLTVYYLSNAYSRSGAIEKAILMSDKALELDPSCDNYYTKAILLTVAMMKGREAIECFDTALELAIGDIHLPECPNMTYTFGWDTVIEHGHPNIESIDYIYYATEEHFGKPHPYLPESFDDSAYNNEHDIVLLRGNDIYVSGNGIYYTKCDVFTGSYKSVIHSDELKYLHFNPTITIEDPVVSLINLNQKNYYHILTETFMRLIYLDEYVLADPDNDDMKIVAVKTAKNMIDELVSLVGIDPERIIYIEGSDTVFFKDVFFVDWIWRPENDLQPDDSSKFYMPPRAGLQLIRERFAEYSRAKKDNDLINIVYISRIDASVRKIPVEWEQLIVQKLIYDFDGRANVEFFAGKGSSIMSQIITFSKADIVVAPHGAGLANLLWVNPNATVIQFPMEPNSDNCFGYLTSALDIESYYLFPEISAYYYGNYNNITSTKVRHLMEFINTIMTAAGKPGTLTTQKLDL